MLLAESVSVGLRRNGRVLPVALGLHRARVRQAGRQTESR